MDYLLRKAYDENMCRTNLFGWYDFNRQGKMLVIGDVGQVVMDYFRKHVSSVDTELAEGVLYDYIVLFDNGMDAKFDVLEPNILRALCRKLRPDGKLFLALPNALGLKYFSGAPDEATGDVYAKLTGFVEDRKLKGYCKDEVEAALKKSGFSKKKFYYPMPDHLFTEAIYSDDFLPQVGDLRGSSPAYVDGGISSFSESMVYDRLCEKGQFPEFANSFLVIAG